MAHVGLTGPAAQQPAIGVPGAGQAWDGRAAFLFVLTHGAGGGVEAPDLLAARDAGLRLGGAVAMVTQPYRVKGRQAPGSAARQDAAWVEIITALRETALREAAGTLPAADGPGIPLIQGGRSNGARVACRTARAVGSRSRSRCIRRAARNGPAWRSFARPALTCSWSMGTGTRSGSRAARMPPGWSYCRGSHTPCPGGPRQSRMRLDPGCV